MRGNLQFATSQFSFWERLKIAYAVILGLPMTMNNININVLETKAKEGALKV